MEWYMYPVTVPFGNSNFDVQLGGSHDLDVGTPANTPITALLPGDVVSLSSPSWGKQIGIQLDRQYNNLPYMAYLHLSAIRPDLAVGMHIGIGELLGWSGGGTTQSQYAGSSNPTGENFLNDASQSSQLQTGLALMRGPEYGVASGWENFPPIDMSLDPTRLLNRCRAAYDTWNTIMSMSYTTAIARSWRDTYYHDHIMPPPLEGEKESRDWNGEPISVQEFGTLRAEYSLNTGSVSWYRY